MWHGRLEHGVQFSAPERRRWGTGYYASDTGAALALESLPGESRRIGMVGLGVGTLATYARPGDYVRVYEINPDVRRLAETRFTYLSDSPAEIDVVMGDARLSMEREAPQAFDLLILDAFSGDAIPVHLLTREAFEIYQRHLVPEGVIALLIDTWHLDFGPVVRGLADHFGFHALRISTYRGPQENWGSDWMLLTRNEAFFDTPAFARYRRVPLGRGGYGPLWTDEYTSLFQVLGD
jgi:spermidine synthase